MQQITMYEECPHGMPYDRRCVHCERGEPESMSMTTDLKKLAEVERWNFVLSFNRREPLAVRNMVSGKWVQYSDHQAAIAILQQEVETLRKDAECWRHYKELLEQQNTSITHLLSQAIGKEQAMNLYDTLVSADNKLTRGKVWCKKCGHHQLVDSARCMQYGWPTHCGETMTIDSPEERGILNPSPCPFCGCLECAGCGAEKPGDPTEQQHTGEDGETKP